MYPASAVGFAAVVVCMPSTNTLVSVGLLALACAGTFVYLTTFVTFAAQSFKQKRMLRRYPEIRDMVRKHRIEYHPDLPDEAELERGMFQIRLTAITSGLVFLFSPWCWFPSLFDRCWAHVSLDVRDGCCSLADPRSSPTGFYGAGCNTAR